MSKAATFPRGRAPAPRIMGIGRRKVIAGLAFGIGCAGVAAAAIQPSAEPQALPTGGSEADWQTFRSRFVTPDGRVVDTGNNGVTHSEGQGYGMLFAVQFDDRATFDNLLHWSRQTLRRPDDALLAWRYKPNTDVPVDDPNNATDGDLLVTLALLRGAQRWGSGEYASLARAMARDLLRRCARRVGEMTVLLPAAFGFLHQGRVVINPSYYVFPALSAIARAAPDPVWDDVWHGGLRLLWQGRYGRWHLPPDWLEIANGSLDFLAPAQGWPARFSWDAVRVPLYLAWAGLRNEPALNAAATFWSRAARGAMPAWADLDDDSLSPYGACTGVAAIAQLARAVHSGQTGDPELPHIAPSDDYYSSALVLLSRIAFQDQQSAMG